MSSRASALAKNAPPASRRQDAYETILDAIIFGDFAPGSRLDEKSLALELGIGIAGVRDALFRLALEGLVVRQPRVATIVATLDVKELQDVFEARILLECQCARIAAQRADAQDIAKLRDMIKEYHKVRDTRDFRQLFRIDQAFHRTIALATQNRLLEQQVALLSNNAARFWFVGITRLDEKGLAKTIQSHIDVVNAITKRDSAAAELAMQKCVGDFPGFVDHFIKNSQIYGRIR